MQNKKLVFIGIVEDLKDKNTLMLLKNLLIQSNYIFVYSNKKGNIICLHGNGEVLVLIYIKPKDINIFQEYMGIKLDLLIYNFLGNGNGNPKFISEELSNCDYIILNGDYINLMSWPFRKLNGIIVTYGFNNKSSLTISSCDDNDNIEANVFLQREIRTLKGEKIEPQEFTIKYNKSHTDNIYSILAASTLSLILGNTIWTKSHDNIIKICI